MGKQVLCVTLVVSLCLLLGMAALAQAGAPAPAAAYVVEEGAASGASYRLAGGT